MYVPFVTVAKGSTLTIVLLQLERAQTSAREQREQCTTLQRDVAALQKQLKELETKERHTSSEFEHARARLERLVHT
jgi:hypothetical protein